MSQNLKCPSDRAHWSKFKRDALIAATGEIKTHLLEVPTPLHPIPASNNSNYFNSIRLRRSQISSLKEAIDFILSITGDTPLSHIVAPHLQNQRPDLAWSAIVNEYEHTGGQSAEALLIQRIQDIKYDTTTDPLTAFERLQIQLFCYLYLADVLAGYFLTLKSVGIAQL